MPAGTGIISYVTSVPATLSTYGRGPCAAASPAASAATAANDWARRTGRNVMAAILVAVGAAAGCSAGSLERFEFRQRQMGVEARIVLYAPDTLTAETAARAAFARIADLDAILSDYRADSELSRASDSAFHRAIPLGDDLFTVLRAGHALAAETGGAFDLTTGAVVALWRRARADGRLPSDGARCDALARSGWRHLVLDTVNRTLRFDADGLRLDAGAIGKGYAADEALAVLEAHGTPRALVAIGGDLVVGSAPPDAAGWTVAIGSDDTTITLAHGAVSASGDAEQFVEIDGVRYSHVVDPRTGVGLTSGVSLTVRAATGRDADAWATAASVLDSAARATFIGARPGATFYLRAAASNGISSRTNVSTACTRDSVSTNVARTLIRSRGT